MKPQAPEVEWIGSLTGNLTIPTCTGPSGEEYDGEYEVVPKAYEDQVLDTAGKIMTSDLKVLAIPFYETTNGSDGLTVYIAEEVSTNA